MNTLTEKPFIVKLKDETLSFEPMFNSDFENKMEEKGYPVRTWNRSDDNSILNGLPCFYGLLGPYLLDNKIEYRSV
jgi:hypothetical protein